MWHPLSLDSQTIKVISLIIIHDFEKDHGRTLLQQKWPNKSHKKWLNSDIIIILPRAEVTWHPSPPHTYSRNITWCFSAYVTSICTWLQCWSTPQLSVLLSVQPMGRYLSSSRGILGLLVISNPKEPREPQRNTLFRVHLRAEGWTQSESVYRH